jgi:hypothetical protein
MSVKLTTEEWIRRAVALHGERYDYSRADYKGGKKNIIIGCSKHGWSKVNATSHTSTRRKPTGCRECGYEVNGRPLNTETWITRAKEKHGNRYDYSRVEYKGGKFAVIIGCEKHGWTSVTAGGHIYRGDGCRDCGYEVNGKRFTIEEWIERAKENHGDKFDYSDSKLIGKRKMSVRCRIHGVWNPDRKAHASGYGCPECAPNAKMDSEKFINKSRILYGERFDYSLVEYVDAQTPVGIICLEHQCKFKVTPHNHLHSSPGCRECLEIIVPTTEEFIDRLRAVHGNKYDYSLVEYVRSDLPVRLICTEHGHFEKTPINLVHHGSGCSKCSQLYSPTTKEWIQRAVSVHGDMYDYSLVEYVNSVSPVEIICKIHGSFPQRPSSHIHQKAGCNKCSGKWKLDSDEFIRRAKEVHGDYYDYSKTEYTTRHSRLIVTCPEHDDFLVIAASHLSGNRCRKCAGLYPVDEVEFINRCMKKYGDRYDYSNLNYVDFTTKVTVGCRVEGHGNFSTIPSAFFHTMRTGCPSCTNHGFQPELPAYYYVNTISNKGDIMLWKGGITNDIKRRFGELRKSMKDHPDFQDFDYAELHRIYFEVGRDAAQLERDILDNAEIIRADYVKGLAGGTELFEEDPIMFAIVDLGVDWLTPHVNEYWNHNLL